MNLFQERAYYSRAIRVIANAVVENEKHFDGLYALSLPKKKTFIFSVDIIDFEDGKDATHDNHCSVSQDRCTWTNSSTQLEFSDTTSLSVVLYYIPTEP